MFDIPKIAFAWIFCISLIFLISRAVKLYLDRPFFAARKQQNQFWCELNNSSNFTRLCPIKSKTLRSKISASFTPVVLPILSMLSKRNGAQLRRSRKLLEGMKAGDVMLVSSLWNCFCGTYRQEVLNLPQLFNLTSPVSCHVVCA